MDALDARGGFGMSSVDVIRYWRAAELLQQNHALNVSGPLSKDFPFILVTSASHPEYPWDAFSRLSRQSIARDREWRHCLFGHIYTANEVQLKLGPYFGADGTFVDIENKSRESSLFNVMFNAKGEVIPSSLFLSSEAWFAGRVINGKTWTDGFEQAQITARQWVDDNLMGVVDAAQLSKLTAYVRDFLGVDGLFGFDVQRTHRFKTITVSQKGSDFVYDPLNSFFLDDLDRVERAMGDGDSSPALDDYLMRQSESGRIHLDQPESAERVASLLSTSRYPLGCWPTENDHGLMRSQQLALNAINDKLAFGAGLMGVSGPPGTGKSTLLRDLIASVITNRADVLATLNSPTEAFEGMGVQIEKINGRNFKIHNLNPRFFGFEMVVASAHEDSPDSFAQELASKNTVENWLPDADYFSEIANNITSQPSIGLVSASLATISKKVEFFNQFWLGRGGVKIPTIEPAVDSLDSKQTTHIGFKSWLQSQADTPRSGDERREVWLRAVEEYKAAKAAEASLSVSAGEIQSSIVSYERSLAESGGNYLGVQIASGQLGKSELPVGKEPSIITEWRKARANVYMSALKLHKVFITLESKRFMSNLSYAFSSIILDPNSQYLTSSTARSAWATLFMVVPVLSSTFNSFTSSFSSLGAAEIGWLFIDDASRVHPQAAVGALWRAKRAVVFGDPFQAGPVNKVDPLVLESMCQSLHIDPYWSPSRLTVQSLANQATQLGQMVGRKDEKHWAGLPLFVHRRCLEPMFTIANRLAYDGAMVFDTSSPAPASATPAKLRTGWIHVEGKSEKNWVAAEADALKKLLSHLIANDGVKPGDISVITPFRNVFAKLRRTLPYGVTSGTIHTITGKKSPIVILLLGGCPLSRDSRARAVATPSLLVVSATRAEERLYVIGDRQDWAKRPFFKEIIDLLPSVHREDSSNPDQAKTFHRASKDETISGEDQPTPISFEQLMRTNEPKDRAPVPVTVLLNPSLNPEAKPNTHRVTFGFS